jgi:hypothetical protein
VLVWSNGDVAGVYFRLLFVALSLAVLDFWNIWDKHYAIENLST